MVPFNMTYLRRARCVSVAQRGTASVADDEAAKASGDRAYAVEMAANPPCPG